MKEQSVLWNSFLPFPFSYHLKVHKKKHLELFVLLASRLPLVFSESKKKTEMYGSISFLQDVARAALVLLFSGMIWFSLAGVWQTFFMMRSFCKAFLTQCLLWLFFSSFESVKHEMQ